MALRPAAHYIGQAGLRGCVINTPGALRSRREAVLAGPVGPDIWRPPTSVGSGVEVRRLMRLRTYFFRDDDRRAESRAAPRYGRAARRVAGRRPRKRRRDDRRAAIPDFDYAGHHRVRLFGAQERDQSGSSDAQARRRGRAAAALPVVAGRGKPLIMRAWRFGAPLVSGVWGIPRTAPGRGRSRARHPAGAAPGVRPRRRPHRLRRRLLRHDHRGAAREKARHHRRHRLRGTEIDAVPVTPRDARLDLVLTEREAIDLRGT